MLGPDLMELCPTDAIFIETVPPGPGVMGTRYFAVDKDKCAGCAYCYESINCHNNTGGFGSLFMRMVAHLEKRYGYNETHVCRQAMRAALPASSNVLPS